MKVPAPRVAFPLMGSSSTHSANGVSQKGKLSTASKHLPMADEGQTLAEAIDKSLAYSSKYSQKRSSRKQQNGIVGLSDGRADVHLGLFVNDLMLVAGEAGMYGLIFKLITLMKQRVDKMKEVDGKALTLEEQSDHIMQCFKRMKARFASTSSSAAEQKSVLTEWEEKAVLLFAECNQVLGRITSKTSGTQLAGSKIWIDKFVRPCMRCLTSPAHLQALDICIKKMDDFATGMLLEDRARTVNNDLPYLGEKSSVGTKFRQSINDLKHFISEPPAGDRRSQISVLHITGPSGFGKSRLAKEILHKLYSPASDLKIELLQIDCSSTSCSEPVEFQRKLLEQMADSRAAEGLSLQDVGYTKLRNVFRAWKNSGHKVVMFFDNAPTNISLLSDILPDDISKLLQSGSCLILSTRGDDSGWEKSGVFNKIQTLFPSPTCRHKVHTVTQLEQLDSRNLFEQYVSGFPPADMDEFEKSSWSEIISDLIGRCEGNPKLLIVLGKFFSSEPRTQSFWKEIFKELDEMVDPSAFSDELLDEIWKEHTSNASEDSAAEQRKKYARFIDMLGLVYRKKLGECQEAMSDISSLFDGWNWNTVEAIVGKDVMRKLKDQKFVSSKLVFDNPNKDLGSNQVHSSSEFAAVVNKCGRRSPTQLKVVQANPELRDTARKINEDKHLKAVNTPMPKDLSDLQRGVRKNLRSLCLVDCTGNFLLRWLDRIQGLHHLILHNIQGTEGLIIRPQEDLSYLYWGSMFDVRFPFEAKNLFNLQTLVLTDFDFSKQPEVEIPSQLQNLSLIRCMNVHLVARAIFDLNLLKSLHLQEYKGSCEWALPGFTQRKSSIPFSLSFQNCADMERIPAFVHNLQRLTDLGFITCPNLKGQRIDINSVANLNPSVISSMRTASFEDCRSLTCLPSELAPYVKSLTELEIRSCQILDIFPQIVLFENLTKLRLASCPTVRTLPSELVELRNLQRLYLEENRGLTTLPSEIGKLQLLKELKLDYCTSLKALPRELENLKCLSSFSMAFCYGLDPKTELSMLPNLGKLQDLRYVNIAGVEPASVLRKLAESTDSIRHSAEERTFTLVKDLPKRGNHLSPAFYSAGVPTSQNEVRRMYRSANN